MEVSISCMPGIRFGRETMAEDSLREMVPEEAFKRAQFFLDVIQIKAMLGKVSSPFNENNNPIIVLWAEI
jgi:hypothetical protein